MVDGWILGVGSVLVLQSAEEHFLLTSTALTKSKISNAGNRTKFKPFSLVVNQPVKPQNFASSTGGVSPWLRFNPTIPMLIIFNFLAWSVY